MPAKTARPHPQLISSQPPPSPLLPLRMAVATTPQPRSSSIAVPVTSETKIVPFETSNTANWGLLRECDPASLPARAKVILLPTKSTPNHEVRHGDIDPVVVVSFLSVHPAPTLTS